MPFPNFRLFLILKRGKRKTLFFGVLPLCGSLLIIALPFSKHAGGVSTDWDLCLYGLRFAYLRAEMVVSACWDTTYPRDRPQKAKANSPFYALAQALGIAVFLLYVESSEKEARNGGKSAANNEFYADFPTLMRHHLRRLKGKR